MGSLVYSLIKCSGHKTTHKQYNIDKNFIMCMTSIYMGITSYHIDDGTHLTYTPLERETPSNIELRTNIV